MRRIAGVLVATMLILGACGSGNSNGVSDEVTAALAPHVDRLRAAAASHDAGTVSAELAAIRGAVIALRTAKKISATAADAILADAAAVEQQTALITTTTSPATAVSRPYTGNQNDGGKKRGGKGDHGGD